MDAALLEDLAASHDQLAGWIRQHAAEDPTQPRTGEWSIRDVAAQMAACEVECIEPRLRSIAAGEQPRFEFYSNDGRDFGDVRLEDALTEWAETRARVLDFAKAQTVGDLTRVGIHATFGEVTVPDYLRILLEHDRGHLMDLEPAATGPAR
jgi:hypothetical protein